MKFYVYAFTIFILIIGLIISIPIFSFNDSKITMTIDEKLTKRTDDTEKYLIFGTTEEGQQIQLENTDSLFRGKFNSSEFQHKIKEGNIYTFTVIGHRVPIFSWYKNIINIE